MRGRDATPTLRDMTNYRISWHNGNEDAGYWAVVDKPTEAEAAFTVASHVIQPADPPVAVFVECVNLDGTAAAG